MVLRNSSGIFAMRQQWFEKERFGPGFADSQKGIAVRFGQPWERWLAGPARLPLFKSETISCQVFHFSFGAGFVRLNPGQPNTLAT
jgi:hypothetical protein